MTDLFYWDTFSSTWKGNGAAPSDHMSSRVCHRARLGWSVAVRNDNPMPYGPRNSAEALLLLETLNEDWTEELLKDRPDWDYLLILCDWMAETEDLMEEFRLWESTE